MDERDLINRCRHARKHCDDRPPGAWSTGERLAVAVVLKNKQVLEEMGYTTQQAANRMFGESYSPDTPEEFGRWLDGIRAQVDAAPPTPTRQDYWDTDYEQAALAGVRDQIAARERAAVRQQLWIDFDRASGNGVAVALGSWAGCGSWAHLSLDFRDKQGRRALAELDALVKRLTEFRARLNDALATDTTTDTTTDTFIDTFAEAATPEAAVTVVRDEAVT